jgi:hypothetical protein
MFEHQVLRKIFGRTQSLEYRLFVGDVSLDLGRAMAQVVTRRPLTAEARGRARVNPCGICGGYSGTATGFSPSS